ncbi:family 1 glycosylhydrolase [Nocardia harenae]|uniref:family 1 glycosylhydrolase n=1 Tax=Nocardia harenae TaxID=358707 RepID=UPI00082B2E8E|nr:family 1 glycosylhydrolase [Nocardia harenae]
MRIVAVLIALLLFAPPQAGAEPGAPAPLPRDFLWGVASSGFQSEGHAPDSNWARYAARQHEPYGDSIDFHGRFREDIALAANLGVRVYRIGVEWARVQPQPGVWDEAGLRFYDEVVAAIRAAGMRPMITLDHWVYPGWQADRGGWADPEMVPNWLANARIVVDRYAAADPLWVTFNEPAVYLLREVQYGTLAATDVPLMHEKIAQAHLAIYDHIHRVQPGAMVTSNVPYIPAADAAINGGLLAKMAPALDYIGIDYYYGLSPAALRTPYDFEKLWQNPLEPEGIYYALRHYARQFPGKPLYIVENGLPTDNGTPRADGYTRADNLRDTVYWLQRAVADGMNLIGYNYWTLTDNYEWGSYAPRFGLYTVDVLTDPTLTRRPTDAVPAYTELIRANGTAPGYLPTRDPAACSLVDGGASCAEPVTVPR